MKKLLCILLFTLCSQFCEAQDSASYFNKTLPKNSVTATLGGETLRFSVGYERRLFKNKFLLLNFSSKISIGVESGIAIPTGIVCEVGKKRSKIILGTYLCHNIDPWARFRNVDDIRRIENNSDYLKVPVTFVWVPYGVITLGYKYYHNTKNAWSFYLNGAVYPSFQMLPEENYKKCKLVAAYYGWGGITYHRQF